MKRLLTLVFLFTVVAATAQDLYIKSYPSNPVVFGHAYNISIESFSDDSYVVGGHLNSPNTVGSVFLRMFNKCGDEVWHKEISDSTLPLNFVSLNIDSNQNILLTGLYDRSNHSPKPYLIKIDKNGNVIFSKLLGSLNGHNHLVYSTGIAANGDYIIYGLHRYTPSPPNHQKMSICRLDANGNLKWAKNYDFGSRSWGRLIATRDNGALAFTSNIFYKIDSLGNIEWANRLSSTSYLYAPIETDSGYVFGRYYIGAIDRGTFFELKHNGSLGWKTDNYMNFYPEGKGTLLKNGNLMYTGSNRLNGSGLAFLELDYKTGNQIRLNQITNSTIANGIVPIDLTETNSNDVVFAGHDNRGILQQLAIGKINSQNGTTTCGVNSITRQSDPFTITENGSITGTVTTNNDYTIVNKSFTVSNITSSTHILDCSYTQQRGNYQLGPDTTICRGQTVILGYASSTFDSYLWSNGSTNKTIAVNQSGTYSLQVLSACDTLRDTIIVSILPGILFSIGPDTLVCGDSLVLGQMLNPAFNYTWSTGETSKTITVRNAGFYWVENSNKCHTTRDSIFVDFQPPIAEIDLGKDTTLCSGQGVDIGPTNSLFQKFEWSTGDTNLTISVKQAGLYWLKASNACQVSIDSILIQYHPDTTFTLGNDTALCVGASMQLEADKPLANYLWSNGSTNSSISALNKAWYWLETQTVCGAIRDSIKINLVPPIAKPKLIADTTICKEIAFELNAGDMDNYLWSNGSTNSTLFVNDSGLYWIQTANQCDTLRDSTVISYHPSLLFDFTVAPTEAFSNDSILFTNRTINGINSMWFFENGDQEVEDSIYYQYQNVGTFTGFLQLESPYKCIESENFTIKILASDFHIPTVFTPDGDGINDYFLPVGKDVASYRITIFNNWGMKVYNTATGPWNGIEQNGKQLAAGSYVYKMQVEFNDGNTKTYVGQVNLIR